MVTNTARWAPRLLAAVGLIAAVFGRAPTASADVLTPGNILVSSESLASPTVAEYTAGGTLIQRFSVPYPGGRPTTEDVRGIATNSTGQVQIYNGTFSPFLTTLTPMAGGPGAGTYTNTTLAGMSLVNNVSFGEIGVIGNQVFAPDMATGNANGIVHFDLAANTATRLATGTDYSTVTVGADGRVYAVNQTFLPASTIDVFDPTTLAFVRTITLSTTAASADLRGIAVDAAGTIFAAGWDGRIYELSSAGAVLNSIVSGKSNLDSIALDSGNRLVVGGRFGDVILTNTSLSSLTSFTEGTEPVHVAFVNALVNVPGVPEPTSLALAWIGAVVLFCHCRRSHRARRVAT